MDKLLLIQELQQQNDRHIAFFKKLGNLSDAELQYKKHPESWNTLECTEHLKRYGDFYIPVISEALKNSKLKDSQIFKTGWLGDYFAKAMLPGSKKMNTFKSKNPMGSNISRNVIDDLLNQLGQLHTLLELARTKDISSIRVKTTIPLAKVNAGDALRVVIYHNERHLQQIMRIKDN
jgi:hypothetical protein